MSGSAQSTVEKLRARLRSARRRLAAGRAARGLLLWLAVGFAALFIVTGLEAVFWLGVGLRTLLFWVFAVGLVGTLAWGLWPSLRALGIVSGEGDRTVASHAEREQPGAGDRISALIDLSKDDSSNGPAPLLESAILALGNDLEHVPFEELGDYRPAKRIAPWAAVAGFSLLLFAVGWPGAFTSATGRVLSPGMAFVRPAPYTISVDPGDATIPRGEDVDISVSIVGSQLPSRVSLEHGRVDEDATESIRLQHEPDDDPGEYRHTLDAPSSSFRYRIVSPDVETPWFRVDVEPRPFIRGMQVAVVPPGYTGQSTRRLAPGVGDVTALGGSTVRLALEFGEEAVADGSVEIDWANGRTESVPLDIRGDQATAQFSVRQAGRYHVALKNPEGARNLNPAHYTLSTLRDGPPQISLLDGFSEPLSHNARRLSFHVSDDFGFSGAVLRWRYAERREGGATDFRTTQLSVRRAVLDQTLETTFRPADLRAGDVIELYGAVRDNDRPAGGKLARSPVVTLRFPTLTDRFDDFNAAQDSTRETLDRLRLNAEEARDRAKELREEIRRDPENLDWEDRRQVEQLQSDQEQLSQEAENVRRQMEELTRRLQEGEMSNPETQQLYEQMQQVMEELQDPSLRDALERLQRAMEEVDLQDLLESSDEAVQDQERLMERIERAIELLERLKLQQQLDQQSMQAEDLAERQDDLRERTREAEESQDSQAVDNLRQEQEDAAEESESLEEGIRELQEQMESMPNAPGDEMQELQQQLDQQPPSESMQDAAQEMEQNQLQEAQESQQQSSQQLREMAADMREMGQQMQSKQQNVDIQALRKSLEDVLTLSKQQEDLADRTSNVDVRSASLRPYARDQVRIQDGLKTVSDTLARVSRSVPQLGVAVTERVDAAQREVGQAMEQLGERRAGPASAHQRSAMSGLNELALVLADVLDQVESQGSGSGSGSMSQQLQQMGKAQQQLNQQIQQMLNETAGQRLSRSQEQRMRELGEAQERVRQQLRRMQQQGRSGGDGEGGSLDAQTQSELERIQQEMQESARELRERNLDNRTLPRQHDILERLLKAKESVNQRGREEQREAETAQPQTGGTDGDILNRGRPEIQIRRDLIRALQSGYARDYEDLIKRYYERRTGSSL